MTALVLDEALCSNTSSVRCCFWHVMLSTGPILNLMRNTYMLYCIYTSINRFKSLCGVSVYGCLSLVSNHLTDDNTDLGEGIKKRLYQVKTSSDYQGLVWTRPADHRASAVTNPSDGQVVFQMYLSPYPHHNLKTKPRSSFLKQ